VLLQVQLPCCLAKLNSCLADISRLSVCARGRNMISTYECALPEETRSAELIDGEGQEGMQIER
jgi:hypothetical protein